MKTIVVGLGNPVLGDDGLGWKVAEAVQRAMFQPDWTVPDVVIECLALGGLNLMEHLIDYDRAILIDAVDLPGFPLGSINRFQLDDLPNPTAGHTSSSHDTSLQKALEVGKSLGVKLPTEIQVITVQSTLVYEFSETLSPQVSAAIAPAARLVLDLLQTNSAMEIIS